MSSLNDLKKTNSPAAPRRNGLKRWLLVVPILLLACAVMWQIFGDVLLPRVTVKTASVVLLDVEGAGETRSSGKAVAQASGWIEPDPFVVHVAAQTVGTVKDVHVLSGETVEEGQVLVELDPADAELLLQGKVHALAAAEKTVAIRDAEKAIAQEALVQVEAEVQRAQSALAVAKDRWSRVEGLQPGDISSSERVGASNQVVQLVAALDSVRSTVSVAEAEIQKNNALRDASVAAAGQARAELELAQLYLDRTTVVSPMKGVVLKRLVEPGDLLTKTGHGVLSLYDPGRLQVRVDVPLSDIQHIRVGQQSVIQGGAFGGKTFAGEVTRITGEADIARNTVQVKVRIVDPDPIMRPEMLCRVEFQAAATGNVPRSGGGAQTLWLPESALVSRESDQAVVWVVDRVRETVSRTPITLGGEERDGLVSVRSGVPAGAHVVVEGYEGLRDGVRVDAGGTP